MIAETHRNRILGHFWKLFGGKFWRLTGQESAFPMTELSKPKEKQSSRDYARSRGETRRCVVSSELFTGFETLLSLPRRRMISGTRFRICIGSWSERRIWLDRRPKLIVFGLKCLPKVTNAGENTEAKPERKLSGPSPRLQKIIA
jgi:hypothetical protein